MSARGPRSHDKSHRDRQIEEVGHDPYHARSKPAEPAVCPQCGLIYHRGRWQRAARPQHANEHLCPACLRINDRDPAGYITLSGSYVAEHEDEVLRLVRNEAARQGEDHPLARIIEVAGSKGKLSITTTDVHLARRIGDALHAAFHGELTTRYSPDEYRVRVNWSA